MLKSISSYYISMYWKIHCLNRWWAVHKTFGLKTFKNMEDIKDLCVYVGYIYW